jgi:predicted nucleic acid-binding protein
VESGATYLVTRDKDMLDLMADPDFTAKYPGLKIVNPVELLRELVPPNGLEPEREPGPQP